MCRTSSRLEKLSLVIFLKKLFLKTSQALTKYSYFKKSFFKKITRLNFSSLNDVLHIFSTCYKYRLCSLDTRESIGNNQSIIRLKNKILLQEKDIFVDFLKMILRMSPEYPDILVDFDVIFDFKAI